jgi:hypothetical protein
MWERKGDNKGSGEKEVEGEEVENRRGTRK